MIHFETAIDYQRDGRAEHIYNFVPASSLKSTKAVKNHSANPYFT
jgi:hypothetical protein